MPQSVLPKDIIESRKWELNQECFDGVRHPYGDFNYLAMSSLINNVPSKSLLSVKGRVSSGGYSNLGTRGKDFQKLMFSKKEKEF